jgi:hypothetical protein
MPFSVVAFSFDIMDFDFFSDKYRTEMLKPVQHDVKGMVQDDIKHLRHSEFISESVHLLLCLQY